VSKTFRKNYLDHIYRDDDSYSIPWSKHLKEETKRRRRVDTKQQIHKILEGEEDFVSLEKKYKGLVSSYD